jgi:hypothetical protein
MISSSYECTFMYCLVFAIHGAGLHMSARCISNIPADRGSIMIFPQSMNLPMNQDHFVFVFVLRSRECQVTLQNRAEGVLELDYSAFLHE